MNPKMSQLRKKAMALPLLPGVYIMHDKSGKIIYIGKAKALIPQIGRGRILAYSRDCGYRNLYNLYDMMSKTDCNIYQEMWNEQVKAYHLTGWIYADELFDLIIEGGNHD